MHFEKKKWKLTRMKIGFKLLVIKIDCILIVLNIN